MGATSSKPMAASAAAIRLEITNQQDCYTGGESIIGNAIIKTDISSVVLHNLTVTLSCAEKCLGKTRHVAAGSARLVSESVVIEAGYHKFAFVLSTPKDVSRYLPTMGAECERYLGQGVRWFLAGDLRATVAGHPATNLEQRYITRRDCIPVAVFPALPMPQRAEAETPVSFFSCSTTRGTVGIDLSSPLKIPQRPKLCGMKVVILPAQPVYVESIHIYLEKHLALWTRHRRKSAVVEVPIGSMKVDRVVAKELVLDGLALGWGLKSRQPEAFMSKQLCLSYTLSIDVYFWEGDYTILHMERRRLVGFYVEPVRPIKFGEDAQGLPAYNEKLGAKDADKSSPQ